MREMRTHFYTFIAAAMIFVAAQSSVVKAQEQDKEAKKPSSSTVDAWRQALPPEVEVERPADATTNVAQPASSRAESEKSVIALEGKWMEALKVRDATALNQVIGDDFTLVSPQFVVAVGDRDKYFNHALRDLHLASYDIDELSVRLYGRTAIVNGRIKQSANVAGVDWGGTYLVTDVWVSRDGIWRVVSRHMSLRPAAAASTVHAPETKSKQD
ncbi:MAG: nuclear transport factor 2 family protein [Pyrinomonadaceae bacterium]